METNGLETLVSPVRKLVRFFRTSRDRWKAKHQQLKQSCKLLRNQTRAVEKSREQWRESAKAADQRIAELEAEVERLKNAR